jgi:hypothetical protein
MLWVNHRRCLVSMGATTEEFYSEVTRELCRFLHALATRNEASAVNRENLAEAQKFAVTE